MKEIMLLCIMFVILLILVTLNVLQFLKLVESLDTIQAIYNNYLETTQDFNEEMQILAETLQTYHELLDSYQIPMIPTPTLEQVNAIKNAW